MEFLIFCVVYRNLIQRLLAKSFDLVVGDRVAQTTELFD